jgi:hypothetical protein
MVKIGRDINEYAFYSLYTLTAPNLIEPESYDYLRTGPSQFASSFCYSIFRLKQGLKYLNKNSTSPQRRR